MIVSISSGLKALPCMRRSHRRLGTIDVTLLSVLYLLSWWVAGQWFWLRCEQRAAAILKHNYGAWVRADLFVPGPTIDLRELWRGRLYLPVRWVTIEGAAVDDGAWGQLRCFRYLESLKFRDCRIEPCADFHGAAVDDGTWEQLRCFRHLESLTFMDCRIEPCADCPIDALCRLRYLTFSRTTLTIDNVRMISRLRHLKSLTLNETGLKGDWLQPLSALPELESLDLRNADLTEVATDSLARMKGLKELQLSAVKTNSELWPALAELRELEALAICETPFDDEGMRHLVGLKKLQVLHLDGAISDAGMASLAQLPNLWRLSLADTNVGDAGLRHLSQLPRLMTLDIRRTRATNACLRSLASIPALKMVLVEGTDINPSAPGFVGVCKPDGSVWYPNEARRKEIEDYSKVEGDSGDEIGTP